MIDLDQLILEACTLEPLPASTLRIADLVAAPDWDVAELTQVIAFDPALTGRLLGLANSAYCAGQRRISEVQDALLRVGPGTVLTLALSASVRGKLQTALPEYGLAEGELWRHSVACALAAERSRAFTRRMPPRESFAAALLHDLGRLVLARHLDPEVRRVLELAMSGGGLSALDAERSVLGVNHAELGALVARQWTLPESISIGIAHHHAPHEALDPDRRAVCATLALADRVATAIGAGDEQRWLEGAPALTETLAGVGLDERRFDELCRDVELHFAEVLSFYG